MEQENNCNQRKVNILLFLSQSHAGKYKYNGKVTDSGRKFKKLLM